ncbi:MAG: HepT-like ribonuclease domain-containing protein [Bacteroidota bacterium]|nr:HepT-like ribonuclease domain-containing protein [Bacteroidota bacterium]
MKDEVKAILFHIQDAINGIELYFPDKKDFYDYKENRMRKKAIERELAIIGEAINRLKKLESSIKIENANQIISLRNFLVHSYEKVEDEIIWGIIVYHLPKLKLEITKLFNEYT